MINSLLVADGHGDFSSPFFEDYRSKEDAVGGQSMLERKVTDLLPEEENYQGAERGSSNDKT